VVRCTSICVGATGSGLNSRGGVTGGGVTGGGVSGGDVTGGGVTGGDVSGGGVTGGGVTGGDVSGGGVTGGDVTGGDVSGGGVTGGGVTGGFAVGGGVTGGGESLLPPLLPQAVMTKASIETVKDLQACAGKRDFRLLPSTAAFPQRGAGVLPWGWRETVRRLPSACFSIHCTQPLACSVSIISRYRKRYCVMRVSLDGIKPQGRGTFPGESTSGLLLLRAKLTDRARGFRQTTGSTAGWS
jgi:hypothetical protein